MCRLSGGPDRTTPLPGVGTLVNLPGYARLCESYPRSLVVEAIRDQIAEERVSGEQSDQRRLALVTGRLAGIVAPRLVPVINATGVVLHTNLGRAPLSPAAIRAVAEVAAGYSNLELDLVTGRRGERAAAVAPLITRLTGGEAALAVNNNAGAILLALAALARGREVIVSRGQQVEIGGSFRMPEVMRLSGARMVEVGATNRTRGSDYEAAVTSRTAALLRVHTSNYRVTGFTENVELREMAAIAARHRILLIDDLGSGALEPIADEPPVSESVGVADVTTFSGDKLVGGPQAGVAVGRAEPIRRMSRHPLARALRADKMTLAALEATLLERLLRPAGLPVVAMLTAPPEDLRRRAALWGVRLAERGVRTRLLAGESAAGGGSLPGEGFPTVLLALSGPASRWLAGLRSGTPAVIGRVVDKECCLDPRTVLPGQDEALLEAVEAAGARLRP